MEDMSISPMCAKPNPKSSTPCPMQIKDLSIFDIK